MSVPAEQEEGCLCGRWDSSWKARGKCLELCERGVEEEQCWKRWGCYVPHPCPTPCATVKMTWRCSVQQDRGGGYRVPSSWQRAGTVLVP